MTHSFPTRRSSDLLRRKALGHGGAIPFFRAMPARLSRRPCCSGRPRERSCPDSSGGTGRKIRPFRRRDRKSVVEGKSVSVRVDLGGRRILKKKQMLHT